MQSTDLLEPTLTQLQEEKVILQEYDGLGTDLTLWQNTYNVTTCLLPIFHYFHYYYGGKLGKGAYILKSTLARTKTAIIASSRVSDQDLWQEIEDRREKLLKYVHDPEFRTHIKDLPLEHKKLEFFTLSILFIQYWLLSAKMYKSRVPSPDYLEENPELEGLVSEHYWLFLQVLNRNEPQLYARIQQTISLDDMGRIEGGTGQLPAPTPLGVQLHQELTTAGAYARIEDLQKRQFLQTFLSSNKSMGDITRATNGQWSLAGVRNSLYASMRTVFPLLPSTTQERFEGQAEKTLQEVIADPVKKEARREKIKAGWQVEKPRHHTQNARKKPGEGKREFSDTHRQNITNANLRRWASYHEQKAQASSTPDQ